MLEAESEADSETLRERVHSLQTWNNKAERLLPWVVKITSPRPEKTSNTF